MPATVGDLLKKIKVSCDNDTLMFCFKDNPIGKAYNRTLLYSPWVVRVNAASSYAIIEGELCSWNIDAIKENGNVAYDDRQYISKSQTTTWESNAYGYRLTKKKTEHWRIDFYGREIQEETDIQYNFNGVEYTTPDGSASYPEMPVSAGENIEDVVYENNKKKFQVYKFVDGEWEATNYFAEFQKKTISSGIVEEFYAYLDQDRTYYNRDIMVRNATTPILNAYYKNSNGNWVDYYALIRTYPGQSVPKTSVKYEQRLKIDPNLLPRCEYIDENNNVFNIDKGDGFDTKNVESLTPIEIDTVKGYTCLSKEARFVVESKMKLSTYLSFQTAPALDGFTFDHWSLVRDGAKIQLSQDRVLEEGETLEVWGVYYRKTNVVTYEPCSIDHPEIMFKNRVMMDDLKIKLPDGFEKGQFLTWLNGAFVPTVQDVTYKNLMYIHNGMTMIWSHCVNQKLEAKNEFTDNATVITSEEDDEYRYDVKLRLFSWKGVKVSDFYKPSNSTTVPITHNFESIYPIKTLTFPVEINKDAHMIICNGKVLNENDYEIDIDDPRKITLTNLETKAYEVLSELATELDEHIEFYEHVNPLHMVRHMLLNRQYSLVNFESTDPNKKIYLRNSNACATNFPYKGEITFTDLNIGDMVLINGLFNPYIWVHHNTIKFPTVEYTYADGVVDRLTTNDVLRYYFVAEDK